MNIIALSFNPLVFGGAFYFIFGLAIGSFLNVISLRYDGTGHLMSTRRLGDRSHCPYCKRQLRFYELIPVASFIMQCGRCRGCGKTISWQYPLIELLTGFAFLLPMLYFYPFYSFPFEHPYREALSHLWLLIALCMIALSLIDMRLMIIPDQIAGALALFGIAFAVLDSGSFLGAYVSLLPRFNNSLVNHGAGGLLGIVLFGLIVVLSRGRAMGMGDVKLAGAMGMILGFPDSMFAFAFAFVAGGVWSAVLLLFRKTSLKTMVPFGPFLVLGFWLHIFFSRALLHWYFWLL